MRIYLYSQYNFKAKHKGFATWIPVKLFEFLPPEPFKNSSVFLKSFITVCDPFSGIFQSPQGNSELLKTNCIHQKTSTLHKLPMGLCLIQLQGPSAVGQSTRGRGEEYFLLKAGVWEEVAGGRVSRLSREDVNPHRQCLDAVILHRKLHPIYFSYFPFYWSKVKTENDLLQNRSASTNRPSYCCLLFVAAFGLLFYFSEVLEKIIWRWHESVKHLNNCHLCNIFLCCLNLNIGVIIVAFKTFLIWILWEIFWN